MKLYERVVLPNGVRLIMVPITGVNSVATAVMVGVGSRYETQGINGINHFLEHMVFKGTKKYPTTDDVNFIERLGGIQNAYTDIDVTNYHNKVLSTDWLQALEINKELALAPLLLQKHVDRERDVIIEEMKRYEDEPAAKVEEAYHMMLYPGTKLGMRIIGTEQSLRTVASAQLRHYHESQYSPDRMVVVIAGALETQDTRDTEAKKTTRASNRASDAIVQKVTEWFGSLKRQKTQDMEPVTPAQKKPELTVVTKPDAAQAHLVLGIRTFERGSRDRFAWNLFNLIMGVSFTSRLFKEIREKRGLCYHVRSNSSNYADTGSWDIYAGVATAKVGEATRAILAELHKVKDKGISEEELTVAKKRLTTLLAFKSEDPEFFSEWYGRQEVYGMPLLTVEEYIQKIQSVTKEDIFALVKKYIRTETLNMAVVWNRKRDEGLEKLLAL